MSRIIVVTGSREALDTEYNRARITAALKPMPPQATVFHGACRGADLLCDDVAKKLGYARRAFPVMSQQWEEQGKSAGHKRNALMLDTALAEGQVLLLAFPVRDAGNRGTKNCIDVAFGRRIDYRVIWLEGN